jgi:hypothetical protein
MSEAVGRVISNSQGLEYSQRQGTGDEGRGTAGDSVILSEAKELNSQGSIEKGDTDSEQSTEIKP